MLLKLDIIPESFCEITNEPPTKKVANIIIRCEFNSFDIKSPLKSE